MTAQRKPQHSNSDQSSPLAVPCPAVEKILVHESLAGDKLDSLVKALQEAGACHTLQVVRVAARV